MENENIKVEYLVALDANKSFCQDEESFLKIIDAHNDLTIDKKRSIIKYDSMEYGFNLTLQNEAQSPSHTFFQININYKFNDSSLLDKFEAFLRILRSTLNLISNNNIQVLWDDVSFYYARKGYPLIHKTENLMRKLITKFMIVNVGLSWAKSLLPESVKDSVKSKDKKDISPDYLYKVDFIQLKDFLFLEYPSVQIDKLYKRIKEAKKIDEMTLEELTQFVPKSNWDRYISSLVNTEDEYISKRWTQLYEYRNKIAHNNNLSRDNFTHIETMTKEINEVLTKAIDNLESITLTADDKDHISNITDNLVSSSANQNTIESKITHDLSRFLEEFKKLQSAILSAGPYLYKLKITTKRKPLYRVESILHDLFMKDLISPFLFEKIFSIIETRKDIIHGKDMVFSDKETLNLFIETSVLVDVFLEEVISKLKKIDSTEDNDLDSSEEEE